MHKLLIIGGGIVFLFVLVFGIYFLLHRNNPENKPDDLIVQKNLLESNLVVAQDKLNQAKETLDTMTNDLQTYSAPVAPVTLAQDQVKKAGDIVKQTDFMFINPEGNNPEFIIKKNPSGSSINNQRREINNLLATNEIDTQKIKIFMQDFSQTVKNLTPANSGLSQSQIDAYVAQIPLVSVINEVVASITSTQTSPISQSPTTQIPQVTPEAVTAEQSVVTQAQNQVAIIEQQLTNIENQIQQTSATSATVTTPTSPSQPQSQTVNSTDSNNSPNPLGIERTSYQGGIIIQPGPPRLIQGSDPY